MRDDFSSGTIRDLANRVNSICSNPECNAATRGPHSDGQSAINIGKAAHITAASLNGPRYDASLTIEQRRSINNGIWLCSNCATLIDTDVGTYTVERLLEWKQRAEINASSAIGRRRDSEGSAVEPESLPSLARRVQQLIGEELRVPSSIADEHSDILRNGDVGIVKLQRRYEDLETVGYRGGGRYFDFVRRDQQYGYGSDLAFRDGKLTVGFAGADYGYLLQLPHFDFQNFLGDLTSEPPNNFSPELQNAWRFLWNYRPPSELRQIRLEQREAHGKAVDGVSVANNSVVAERSCYLLRSMQFKRHDVLVGFQVVNVLSDGAVVIIWKILNLYDIPVAVGSDA